MKISYNWLKHIFRTSKTPEQIAALLTSTGLEVGEITSFQLMPENLVLGKIIHSEPHPNADRLRKTLVDIGEEKPLSIVCGAPNAFTGKKVVVAPVGTTLSLPDNKILKIKKTKIRGEVSEGMLCAGSEIGLDDPAEEILTLNTRQAPGTPIQELWKIPTDTVFEVDLTPNRSDAISHLGVARDLAAALGRSLEDDIVDPFIATDSIPLQISVKESAGCPRYCGVVMKNVHLRPSPPWIQARLKAIGLRPTNNVVDITNFIMYELGQPLHAFDYQEIAKKQINVKVLPEGTPFVALDGKEHLLKGNELMICDTVGPLCMAGVIGGERGKVKEGTSTIFLESAHFAPSYVYRAAKQHKLATDASYRFERGTDPNIAYTALQKAVILLQKYASAEVASMVHDHYPEKIQPQEIALTYDYIHKMIGCEIPTEKIHKILENLEIYVSKKTESGFLVHVPPYRRDVCRPIDVVEEILRIYGYERIKPTKEGLSFLAGASLFSQKKRLVKKSIKQYLATKGYNEIITNSLISSGYLRTKSKKTIQLTNPLSEKLDIMRHTLLFSGLEVVQYNLKRKQEAIHLFEVGKVYRRDRNSFYEPEKVGLWLAGTKKLPSWDQKASKVAFSDLYGSVEELMASRGITLLPPEHDHHEYYSGRIKLQSEDGTHGYIGQVAPSVLDLFGIREPVFFAELHLKPLLKTQALPLYDAPSKYPPISRDISLAVAKKTTFAEIQQVVTEEAIPELQQLHLIDYYKDPALGEDKKSYTIRLTFQSECKTLSDKEVNKMASILEKSLTERLKTTIRI